MTAIIRLDPAVGLSNEVQVAAFLAGAGVAVVEPTDMVAAGVYRHEGSVMTFWRCLEHDKSARPDALTAGQTLRRLHDVLLDCPVALPELRRLSDVDVFLDGVAQSIGLALEDHGRLRREHEELSAQLQGCRTDVQPLHGDAGLGNLHLTAKGWTWFDLEDTCRGPAAWDVAYAVAGNQLDRRSFLNGYGRDINPETLRICERLRRLHLTVWYCLYADQLPEHPTRANELLASWR
ncbi:MAG TPA: phosphotransferase [Acidothermaceae bacterium]